jgi:glycosyltransferase involved in cell wall biosynthesis
MPALEACSLITIYDHPDTIRNVVAGLVPLGLPCLIVDDGSGPPTRRALEEVQAEFPHVRVNVRARNGGRGAALKTGYRWAHAEGFTHALQLDADGQHDPGEAGSLLEASRRHPDALVLGDPIFDDSAPRSRLYGRLISRFWVWVDTWSFDVHDPLCGMRCVPLADTVALLDRVRCGDYMDFDPELTVRLMWRGVPVVNVPIHVRYFEDGISHFHLFRDNVRLSLRYTRLSLGMLARAPRLLVKALRGRPAAS